MCEFCGPVDDSWDMFVELRDIVEEVIVGVESGDINFEAAIEKLKAAV